MRKASGTFANWRIAMVLFTQLLYYGLPWLSWNGRQAVLFDLVNRKFYLFGLTFFPQDFIYLAAFLMLRHLACSCGRPLLDACGADIPVRRRSTPKS